MTIKVTDNGVPLSAVVSVEIREPLLPYQRAALEENRRLMVISARLGYEPPLTLEQAKALRDRWLGHWPEVARFFSKK